MTKWHTEVNLSLYSYYKCIRFYSVSTIYQHSVYFKCSENKNLLLEEKQCITLVLFMTEYVLFYIQSIYNILILSYIWRTVTDHTIQIYDSLLWQKIKI